MPNLPRSMKHDSSTRNILIQDESTRKSHNLAAREQDYIRLRQLNDDEKLRTYSLSSHSYYNNLSTSPQEEGTLSNQIGKKTKMKASELEQTRDKIKRKKTASKQKRKKSELARDKLGQKRMFSINTRSSEDKSGSSPVSCQSSSSNIDFKKEIQKLRKLKRNLNKKMNQNESKLNKRISNYRKGLARDKSVESLSKHRSVSKNAKAAKKKQSVKRMTRSRSQERVAHYNVPSSKLTTLPVTEQTSCRAAPLSVRSSLPPHQSSSNIILSIHNQNLNYQSTNQSEAAGATTISKLKLQNLVNNQYYTGVLPNENKSTKSVSSLQNKYLALRDLSDSQ